MKTILLLLPCFLALSAAVPVNESTQKRDPGWEAPFKAVTMRVMKKNPSREEYLQASQSRFWVGGEPSTSCPDKNCSEIKETVLNGGKMDSLVNTHIIKPPFPYTDPNERPSFQSPDSNCWDRALELMAASVYISTLTVPCDIHHHLTLQCRQAHTWLT